MRYQERCGSVVSDTVARNRVACGAASGDLIYAAEGCFATHQVGLIFLCVAQAKYDRTMKDFDEWWVVTVISDTMYSDLDRLRRKYQDGLSNPVQTVST